MSPPPPKEICATQGRWAFFLDIDGTLIDLASEPEKVIVPAGLPDLLLALEAQFDGALALNTGRQLAIVDRMMAPVRLAAAGVHGTELRTRRGDDTDQLAPALPRSLVTEVEAAAFTLHPDLNVEDKNVGIAVHFRHVPDFEAKLHAALSRIVEAWPQIEMRPGRKVLELVPRGLSKATAIAHFLDRAPFRGRLPVVIGDDVGDDPALAYARARGGLAMTVAGEHVPPADATFRDTASVRAWLQEIAACAQMESRTRPARGITASRR